MEKIKGLEVEKTVKHDYKIKDNPEFPNCVVRMATVSFEDGNYFGCEFTGVQRGAYTLADWVFLGQLAEIIDLLVVREKEGK